MKPSWSIYNGQRLIIGTQKRPSQLVYFTMCYIKITWNLTAAPNHEAGDFFGDKEEATGGKVGQVSWAPVSKGAPNLLGVGGEGVLICGISKFTASLNYYD